MKRVVPTVLCLVLSFTIGLSQTPEIVEQSAHHRIWQTVTSEVGPSGEVLQRTNRYTELATGMAYIDQETGEWKPTQELIEPFQDGTAVARYGGHMAIFAPNANTDTALDLSTPDGRFRSHVLSLSFYDVQRQEVAVIARIKDAVAEIIPPNQIIYRNAFDGVQADILLKYTKAGIEQDIILRESLPFSPQDVGFSTESTLLEVTTAFLEHPVVSKLVRQKGIFRDEAIRFGTMMLGSGVAFLSADRQAWSTPIYKTWITIDDAAFLVEAVPFTRVADRLQQLPQHQAALKKPSREMVAKVENGRRPIPSRTPSLLTGAEVQLARNYTPQPGLSLDYTTVYATNSWIFKANETYYVSAGVILSNVVFEGGTVIKYAREAYLEISLWGGSPACTSGDYRPILMTAVDDHTIGQQIGSGTLSGFYAEPALKLHDANHSLNNIRISHAAEGISLDDGSVTVRHGQFVHCRKGFKLTAWSYSRNVLFSDVVNPYYGSPLTVQGEHLTVHRCDKLVDGGTTNTCFLNLTNSILVRMTNGWGPGTFTTNVVLTGSDSSVFAQVGAGAHYLSAAANSWRGLATTNINAQLLSELRKKTTSAPLVLTNKITIDKILAPQARRGIDELNPGAYYDPIDYAVNLTVTNATLLLTNGVALAVFGDSGIWLQDNAKLRSAGRPDKLNQLTRYYAVQEQTTNWANTTVSGVNTIVVYNYGNSPPVVDLTFTQSTIPAQGGSHLYSNYQTGYSMSSFGLRHCAVYGGALTLEDTDSAPCSLLNGLFERVAITVKGFMDFAGYNNTFRYCSGTWSGSATDWVFKDNLLDESTIWNLTSTLDHDYNFFYNSSKFYQTYTNTTHEKVLTNLTYSSGSLGPYYYGSSTPMVDAGSRAANTAGLFHFTTRADDVKETNSTVNLGYHYVAVDSGGYPIDSDGDGLSDEFEDDGDGVAEAGEFNWQVSDTDTNGLNDLLEYALSFNVLVNDPAQDVGNEKNSQAESTTLSFDNRIIVAYVDTNRGATGYGTTSPDTCFDANTNQVTCVPSDTVDFIGWSLSRDGGVTFQDMDHLFYLQPGAKGNAGDPVLARDSTLRSIYLAGNPQRPSIYYPDGTNNPAKMYTPLWRSTDDGESFLDPINAVPGLSAIEVSYDQLDKPALAVDNFSGAGNGNLYLVIGWRTNQLDSGLVLSRSSPGGTNWQVMHTMFGGAGAVAPLLAIGPQHEVYVAWSGTNGLLIAKSTNAMTNFTAATVITRFTNATFHLKRWNSTSSTDYFDSAASPLLVANPVLNGHLYLVYQDATSEIGVSADPNIYFIQSTNGGSNWNTRIPVNSNTNVTDQWLPSITVKPDGTKLFIAWYDRRDDPSSNSLIRMYGVFANLPVTNSASFGLNFPISNVQFPPAFTGTNLLAGTYDPIFHPDVGPFDSRCCESFGGYYSHFMMNDYHLPFADDNYVYYAWSDYRLTCSCTNGVIRNQPDVRLIKVCWPP